VTDRGTRAVRTVLGLILAAGLVCVAVRLAPPYFDNSRFQSYLEDAVARPVAPEILKTDIVNRAAQMGLPLHESDVRMTPTAGNGLKVDIVYVNRVDLKLYTVDLHFHPSARR
jgi:hypothetical protein